MIRQALQSIRAFKRFLGIAAGLALLALVAEIDGQGCGFALFYPNGTVYLKRIAEKPAFIYRTSGAQTCEGCHRTLDPGIDAAWRGSVHHKANVGCADCHGSDHEAVFAAKGKDSAGVCGTCHEQLPRRGRDGCAFRRTVYCAVAGYAG